MKSTATTNKLSPIYQLTLALFVGGVFVGGLGCTKKQCRARDAQSALNTVSVSASAKAEGVPNMATVRLGVETRATQVEDAVKNASAAMRRIQDSLGALGIDKKDLRTDQLSVHMERVRNEDGKPTRLIPESRSEPTEPAANESGPSPKSTSASKSASSRKKGAKTQSLNPGFIARVTNQLHVTVRGIDSRGAEHLGKVVGAALDAGANNVWGITFLVEDTSALEGKARSKAIDKAKEKAEQLAARAGAKLGRVLNISDGAAPLRAPFPMSDTRVMRAEAATSVPVEHGQVAVHQSVTVVYALE